MPRFANCQPTGWTVRSQHGWGASTGCRGTPAHGSRRGRFSRRPTGFGGCGAAHGCAPTLLLVGGYDDVVITFNEQALERLGSPVKELVIVPGATHLFEEKGKLEEVARLAANWFRENLGGKAAEHGTKRAKQG